MHKKPVHPASKTVAVWLDGRPITLPAERRSLGAIRTYLETLALEQERVLCAFQVDGRPEKFSVPGLNLAKTAFSRVEGTTVGLTEIPLRMMETALSETANARITTLSAITLVLINSETTAREMWWDLARRLKEPLLTLSLLPETIYQAAPGCASLQQMRQWQLQQLGSIIKDVEVAAWSTDPTMLSNALETRVLPWLHKLHQMILLWRETVRAGVSASQQWDRDLKHFSI